MRATLVMAILVSLALLAVLVLTLRAALVAYAPGPTVEVAIDGVAGEPPVAGAPLHLFCWNIGYAGLGQESEFIADGGRRLRAPSRSLIERNVAAISDRVRAERADVLMLQELSRDSYLTYGIDVLGAVRRSLEDYALAFAPAVRVTGLPVVGNLEVGNATMARQTMTRAVRHALPSERRFTGITIQHFNVLESRLSVAGEGRPWVLFNLHLAAFDDGTLRRRQLDELFRLLQEEYQAGSHVIAGGDWNMRLAATEFSYTTEEKAKFWVRDFPADRALQAWQWAIDATRPTCRTLERPYRPGVNYTCVIDGFLVSPNVEVLGVETLDLGFVNSDHNPVRLRVRAR